MNGEEAHAGWRRQSKTAACQGSRRSHCRRMEEGNGLALALWAAG